ncbi:unnamed protein product [Blepharisma stoltei]|uniref:Uncharacterized protein n=1 Tax=Blepharisma stoltei TaxID=1481888 RepID=A0AAU9JGJ3_9CILI|nr:unnamed protein product [Blepharisma stoltei]
MLSSDCAGCSDPVKRAILYSKNPNSLCSNCRSVISIQESTESISKESFFETEDLKYPHFRKQKKKRFFNTFTKMKKYAHHLSKQIGNRFTAAAVRKARQEYRLAEKLAELHDKASQKTREHLVKAIRTCYVRDYNLEQVNAYLRQNGPPFENLADIFQDLYDNYINRD